jgi:CHASE2 domain-containing sensor protein
VLRRRRPATRLTLAVAALVAAACAAALPLGVGSGVARQAADAFFPRGKVDGRLLVVAIDRRSLDEPIGQSWGYRQVADLVERLAASGTGAIVLDVDSTRLLDTDNDTEAARGDEVLARAVGRAGNVAVAVPPADLDRSRPIPGIRQESDVAILVVRAARAFGLGNLTADPGDRVVRSVPLVAEHRDGRLLPGLALAALSGHEKFTTDVTARPGRSTSVAAGSRRPGPESCGSATPPG